MEGGVGDEGEGEGEGWVAGVGVGLVCVSWKDGWGAWGREGGTPVYDCSGRTSGMASLSLGVSG